MSCPLSLHVIVRGWWLFDMAFMEGLWLCGLFASLKETCLLLFWSMFDRGLGVTFCCPIFGRLSAVGLCGCCWLFVLGSIFWLSLKGGIDNCLVACCNFAGFAR